MYNHMKQSFFWRAAVVLLAVMGLGMNARATGTPMFGEDHFEQSYNYDAYSLGQGRFHVKVLIFADGLPDWLSVDRPYGSIDPQESIILYFSLDSRTLAVGTYSEIIYLTDEDGLSEPLKVRIDMKALCLWSGVETANFDRQMSLCGQVMIDGLFLTNPDDVVVAMLGDTLVGFAHVDPNPSGGGSYVFMTIYGTQFSEGRQLKFRPWQSSTGHVFNLTAVPIVAFQADGMVGLPPQQPVLLYSNSSSVQYFDLQHGWNWLSLSPMPWAARYCTKL